jgi:hypothetical protein
MSLMKGLILGFLGGGASATRIGEGVGGVPCFGGFPHWA